MRYEYYPSVVEPGMQGIRVNVVNGQAAVDKRSRGPPQLTVPRLRCRVVILDLLYKVNRYYIT